MKRALLERDIEQALIRKCRIEGWLCDKFSSPGSRSVPDRIVTMPGGRVMFVELKRPGAIPTVLQQRDLERRRMMGCDVRVIDSLEEVNALA